jgi:uncharacterized protein YndB with AHSA1/START domain
MAATRYWRTSMVVLACEGPVGQPSAMFVAEAERRYESAPEDVFDRLADARGWEQWMPRSFRPARTPAAPLRSGDHLRVRVAGGPPTTLEVVVSDRAREMTWTGGFHGILFAEHRFLFERRDDGGTLLRSVEVWSGALASMTRPIVKPLAERIARGQLDGLGRALAKGEGEAPRDSIRGA